MFLSCYKCSFGSSEEYHKENLACKFIVEARVSLKKMMALVSLKTLAFFVFFVFVPVTARFSDLRLNVDTANAPFIHGVASGDPISDSVLIWTRIDSVAVEENVSWAVWAQDDGLASFENPLKSGSALTSSDSDYTVTIDVNGLEPNTRYFYQFEDSASRRSMLGKTYTLPDGSFSSEFNVAATSCTSLFSGYMHSYREIAERDDLHLVLHLGDFIYPDADPQECNRLPRGLCDYTWWDVCDVSGDPASNGNVHIQALVESLDCTADDLSLYRWVHQLYNMDPDFRAARAAHPFIVLYDNHDINESSPLLEGGLEAFLEWTPMRVSIENNIVNSSRHFKIGSNYIDLITLDTNTMSTDDNLLGIDQENWLSDVLSNSSSGNSKWRLIANPKMVVPYMLNGVQRGIAIIFAIIVGTILILSLICGFSTNQLNGKRIRECRISYFLPKRKKNLEENTKVSNAKVSDVLDTFPSKNRRIATKVCFGCTRCGICSFVLFLLLWIVAHLVLSFGVFKGEEVVYLDPSDHVWGGNFNSIQRIFSAMDEHGAQDNNVWIAGDMHFSVLADVVDFDEKKADTLLTYDPQAAAEDTNKRYGVECITPSGSRGNVDEKILEVTGYAIGSVENQLLSSIVDFVTKTGNNHFRYYDGSQHGYTSFKFTPNKVSAEMRYHDIRDISGKSELFETLIVDDKENKWT